MANKLSALIQASANSTDTTSAWFVNPGVRGAIFTFDITAQSATAILPTFTVQGRVGGSTKAYNVASLASTTPSGVAVLVVCPSASTAGSEFPAGAGGSTGPRGIVALPLPAQFRVRSTNAGSGTVTWAGWVDLVD